MIYILWALFFVIDKILLILSLPLIPFLSLFTANGWPKWGSIFWTYDNPPQGDLGYQAKRAPYCPASSPWELYVNRVFWLYRNPNYGFNKLACIIYGSDLEVKMVRFGGAGDMISDKYRHPGWYYAECRNHYNDLIAFEFYAVLPWSENHDLRIRLGWKILTNKFQQLGFAPLVGTINPFDGYGNK